MFKGYEGTVEDIQTRATFLLTYDGRRAIIPNGELYTNSVIVNTAFPTVTRELRAAGIDLPFPTRQILFHDQTEETDGDRRRQREGWPPGSGAMPAPHGIADTIRDAARGAATDGAATTGAPRPRSAPPGAG